MADAAGPVVEENAIFEDPNFKKLIAAEVSVDKMTALIEEHAPGYSSKKRLHDGLKDFVKKVGDAEQRAYVVKQVGKGKAIIQENDKILTTLFDSVKLKEKSAAVDAMLGTMIENGSLTRFEKSSVVDNLRSRIQKAKDGGKPKVVEKLDPLLDKAVKASGHFTLPVNNIKELHRLTMEIYPTEQAPKAKAKASPAASPSLRAAPAPAKGKRDVQEGAAHRAGIERQYNELEAASAMWFETALEFKPRAAEAVAGFAEAEKKRIAKEEAEAFAKKILEEEQALIRKKEAAAARELEQEKAIDAQLKARRAEAALKPVVEVVKEAPKERKILPPKPKAAPTDALAQVAAESEDIWESLARRKAEEEAKEAARRAAEEEEAARIAAEEEAAALAEQEAKEAAEKEKEAQKEAERARLKKQLDEASKKSKDEAAAGAQSLAKQKAEKAAADAAAKKAGKPSVSLVQKGPPADEAPKVYAAGKVGDAAAKASPALAPKPRPVRQSPSQGVAIAPKWGAPAAFKLDDDGGELLERLAALEVKQKAERAAKALEAEQEAARIAAEEEAALLAEQKALEKAKKEKEAEREAERARLRKQLDDASKRTKEEAAAATHVMGKQKAEKAAAEAAAKAAAEKAAKPSVSLVQKAAAAKAGPEAAAPKAKAVRKAPAPTASVWGAPVAFKLDDDGGELLERLAAQEVRQKAERAAKALEAEQEAARKAAAEEAELLAEQHASEEKKKEREAEREAERVRLKKQLDDASKRTKEEQAALNHVSEKQKAENAAADAKAKAAAEKAAKPSVSLVQKGPAEAAAIFLSRAAATNEAAVPKPGPVRKAPVATASKWGAPPKCDFGGDDLLEKLAAQEAADKKERDRKAAEAAEAAGEDGADEEAVEEAPAVAASAPQVAAAKAPVKEALNEPGPSLAEAAKLKAPKKVPGAAVKVAQPKKKMGWGKVDASLLGSDENDADFPTM